MGYVCITWMENGNDADKCSGEYFHMQADVHGTEQKPIRRTLVEGRAIKATSTVSRAATVKVTHVLPGDGTMGTAVNPPPRSDEQIDIDANLAADVALMLEMQAGALKEGGEGGKRRLSDAGTVLLPSGRRMDDGTNIDLIAVWTAEAQLAAGGEAAMRTFLATNYAVLNEALRQTMVPFTITVVYSGLLTTYTEISTGIEENLVSVRDNAEMLSLRLYYKADLVQLVVSNVLGDTGGKSYTSAAPTQLGYVSAVKWTRMAADFLHIHEIGHNLGAGHDSDNNNGSAGYGGYGTGDRRCNSGSLQFDYGFKSVMAYNCEYNGIKCVGCKEDRRYPLFSAPDLNLCFGGYCLVTGTAVHDNRRAIMEFAPYVANLMASTSGILPGEVKFELSPGNGGCLIYDTVNANAVTIPTCLRATNQLWAARTDGTIRSVIDGWQCLTASTGDVVVLPCSIPPTTTQQWSYALEKFQSLGVTGCLNNSLADSDAIMYPCSDDWNVHWRIYQLIQTPYEPNKCLTSEGAEDTMLYMDYCTNLDSQRFYLTSIGEIKAKSSETLCVDFNYTDNNLHMHTCNGGFNQLWDHDPTTMVLKTRYTAEWNALCTDYDWTRNLLYVHECTGGDNQKWFINTLGVV